MNNGPKTMPWTIEQCSLHDYQWIFDRLEAFWGDRRTEHIHHPMFVHEFGNTAYAAKVEGQIVGYAFAFFSQRENAGYIHALGVLQDWQRKGIARSLYAHFFEVCKAKNKEQIKAITTPRNKASIAFHKELGFDLVGTVLQEDIPVVPDYSGRGRDRVVMVKRVL